METLKKAVRYILLMTAVNVVVALVILFVKSIAEFKGYLIGTIVNSLFATIWYLGAKKGMKSNTLVLLLITVGGFPIRLAILALFAFGGLLILQMNTFYFAIAFFIGTVFSLAIEVWFFNTLSFPGSKKIR
ncbi:MAG: hypothetical protein N2316_00450 [Spirochaetes bacterium]|nr:hypothetical protein [Spirochaetota bacterium]